MALITCRGTSFAYEGNIVVKGLSFEVRQGDYLCIVGENGSGKTTLMKGLLGLLRPASGSIAINMESSIGYLPQQSSLQKDFPASVAEVVVSGRLYSRGIMPFYSKMDRQIADENMKKLGVFHLKKKSFRELSGGLQQRALLARALCATDKLLLLDEPVSGLDPHATADLYQTIHALWEDANITVIMISHDVNAAIQYASNILHLHNKQLFFGKTEEYRVTDLGKRYLGGGES